MPCPTYHLSYNSIIQYFIFVNTDEAPHSLSPPACKPGHVHTSDLFGNFHRMCLYRQTQRVGVQICLLQSKIAKSITGAKGY